MALVPAKHKIETKSEVPKRNMIESSPIKHATPLAGGWLVNLPQLRLCGKASTQDF
jgi:hypothetical protein